MADVIGEFVEKPGEFHGEWRIPDYLSLSEEMDTRYWSGTFFFSNACWVLKLYPHGQTKFHSEDWIGLYLKRTDSGPSISLTYSLGVKKKDGTSKIVIQGDSRQFSIENRGWGSFQFLKRAELLSRKSDLITLGALTITCDLKSNCQHSMDASLCRRLWNMSLGLQGILSSQEKTDVTLKLEDGEMRAHRVILGARSEVFNRMFATDMRESQTGEVDIKVADKMSFRVVLAYVYGGEPTGLCSNNVIRVYKTAHFFGLTELVRLCAEIMQECLTVDTVCAVITLAELYKDTALKERAREFFANNAAEVLKTDKWQELKMGSPIVVSQLLESIIVDNEAKIKS